jgi:outer membrane protein
MIWNIVLTLAVAVLLILQFTGRKKAQSTTKYAVNDTTTHSGFRIAYFEMDSVAAKFDEVKTLKAELSKREEDNNNELNKMTQEFRDKYTYYQKEAEAGRLSEAQSMAANEEMKKMDEAIKNRKQQLDQDYNDFMMRRQNDIKARIEEFIKEYNQQKGYSFVVSDDPGLFYYQDTTYNITADVIRGLNKKYPPKKEK